MDSLSIVEKTRLEQCEAVIAHGVKTFIDVGNALSEIRDSRLYRLEYPTFEEYCREKWNMERNYANKMIASSRVIGNLGTIVPKLPETESQARPLAPLAPEEQVQVWQKAVETAPEGKITAAHVQETVNQFKSRGIKTCDKCGNLYDGESIAFCPYCNLSLEQRIEHETAKDRPHVSYNSGENEWYTPPEYIEAARAVMGSIDADPASSEVANRTVKATVYFDKDTNGLAQKWSGSVWMNPPYSSDLIGKFCEKLVSEYCGGNTVSAVVLVNNATETGWFQSLLEYASCVCFIKRRVKFLDVNGNPIGAPLQGQAALYFGMDKDKFLEIFGKFGKVLYG